ncbi:gamma-glutamylaminecyclotransferase C-like [Oppia nitens]|uniref:gamma-glutamylaminecyclotransferase C-like n=1 Tax=Oppia nitens TaxID=1686743 RepID=UPI0023D9E46F|nr:gamma-glutamylaminecyclotransferase C-like [Oppia nitens]
MSGHLVFVYGTLKTGQPNHYLLNDKINGFSKFVGKAQTVDKWPLVISSKYNIPFLLNKQDFGKKICGEIYSVDDKMRDFLDKFECHPTYYKRLETPVILEDGSQMSPWIYFLLDFKPEMLNLITYGNYDSYGDHGLPYVESETTSSTDDMWA